MTQALSANTQTILLLTAPLAVGRARVEADLLEPAEYRSLARLLHSRGSEPADLLTNPSADLLEACESVAAAERLRLLLGRGFQLSQAVDRWSARSIWVVSRADTGYPPKLRGRLKEHAPPVLYGCGQLEALDTPGLAIVGSRRVDEDLLRYTEDTGQLTARAGWAVVSGGARGVDQAAMRGGLEAGGTVVGILADRLESAALQREHRVFLMEGRLVLVSPYDPAAGFNVGNAMARNKLIYAQAEAALVVNADYQKGGTWAGAVEQLRTQRGGPVYVRDDGGSAKGLRGLQEKGALPWPNPQSPEALAEVLQAAALLYEAQPSQAQLDLTVVMEPEVEYEARTDQAQSSQVADLDGPPALAVGRSEGRRARCPRTSGQWPGRGGHCGGAGGAQGAGSLVAAGGGRRGGTDTGAGHNPVRRSGAGQWPRYQ